MPTVREILSDIDTRLPSTFTTIQKVNWLNEGLRKVFKYMPEVNKTYELYQFFTESDVDGNPIQFYYLPENCDIDMVLRLQITKDVPSSTSSQYIDYEYCPLEAELTGNKYFDGLNGTIGIYPIPDAGWDCKLYYSKRPFLLTADDLDVTPEINEDYQDAIKYYAMQIVASAGHNPDTQLANLYRVMYNEVLDQMFKDLLEKKVKNPVKKRSNRWW